MLRRIGWVALVAQPLVTFAIMVLVHADVDTRVMMLMAMVVGVIVVDTYLIVISYLDTNLAHQLAGIGKILLCFSGKTHNDVCGKGNIANLPF